MNPGHPDMGGDSESGTRLEARFVVVNGIRLQVREAGPAGGPPVILLHGFPEFSFSWRKQAPVLAAAGYRVCVPDQRGYHLSDRPPRVRDYTIDRLGGDLLGLIGLYGGRASVIGHDWGAMVAWWTAAHFPEAVDRLVILNVPHPTVMARTLRRNLRQLIRSWYIFFFQLPWIPQQVLGFREGWLLERALVKSSRPGTFPEEDLQQYRKVWRGGRSIRPMVHWYRAAARRVLSMAGTPQVETPTCILWGDRDLFLGPEMVEPSARMCRNSVRVRHFPALTHWLHLEAPGEINEELLNWLGRKGESQCVVG